ncbi:MAG TPA: hypothetical protein VGL80_18290 [Pseudonocardiaceae bacterium]
MNKTTGSCPALNLDTADAGIVSHAGATPLLDTIRTTGLEQASAGRSGRMSTAMVGMPRHRASW